jgi:23S rRNA pseudouridine1911/1915/1917 synthase
VYIPRPLRKAKLQFQKEYLLPLNFINMDKIQTNFEAEPLSIIDQSAFLVISKPVGMHSHPLTYEDQNNVLSVLRNSPYAKYLNTNSSSYGRGLLNRLDFETSGLLIYVKNMDDYSSLIQKPHRGMCEKSYLAIVQGKLDIKNNQIIHYLRKTQYKGFLVQALDHAEADSKKAMITISTMAIDESKQLSLLKITLHEGHRHQIRAQMAKLGHPIFGDPLYSSHNNKIDKEAPRMFLHSFQYCVEIRGEKHWLSSEVPSEFSDLFPLLLNLDSSL